MNYVIVRIEAATYREVEQLSDGRFVVHYAKKDVGDGIVECAESLLDHQPTPEEVAEMEAAFIEKQKEYEEKQQSYRVKAEVYELKQKLNETDYIAIKYAEGWISAEDYAATKAQRQQWRDRINELEDA